MTGPIRQKFSRLFAGTRESSCPNRRRNPKILGKAIWQLVVKCLRKEDAIRQQLENERRPRPRTPPKQGQRHSGLEPRIVRHFLSSTECHGGRYSAAAMP